MSNVLLKVLLGGIKGSLFMMYPYMTLNDDIEITHSEMLKDGRANTGQCAFND